MTEQKLAERYQKMTEQKELETALAEMIGVTIITVGFIKEIAECGMYFDYNKDDQNYRLVLGYNELGGWIEYKGKLADFSLEKCLTARIK